MREKFDLIEWLTQKRETGRIIWIFNIGTEKYWSKDNYTITDVNEELVINHIEEMNLLITRKQDILILRKQPNETYLKYMESMGFEIPEIVCPDAKEDDVRPISELILEDKKLLEKLRMASNDENVYMVPYGISYLEEKISKVCNLKIAGVSSEIVKKINNKSNARKVAEKLGFEVTQGQRCYSFDEILDAYNELKNKFDKVIVKQCFGASGKGLYVVDNERELKKVIRILKHFNKNAEKVEWLVEGWYDKKADINYQIYVGEDGQIKIFSIKEQLLNETVYTGSLIPPRLPKETIEQIEKSGYLVGKELFKEGFRGVLGVDAFVTSENVVIPVIEINARFTLSTYISFLNEKFLKKVLYSFYEKIMLRDNVSFEVVKNMLADSNLEYDIKQGKGVFCYVSETIKDSKDRHNGRFFAVVIADSYEEAFILKEQTNRLLEEIRRN